MTRLVIALCAVGICVVGGLGVSSAAEEKKAEKIPIKKVMAKAHKSGLWKKVAGGQAGKKEKTQLLILYKGLAANDPPKGDKKSWKTKTKALVVGAQAAVDGKKNAGALLRKAVNCKACHSVHKP